MTIVNDDARIVNKLDASLTDDTRVIIYDRQMFIIQATGLLLKIFLQSTSTLQLFTMMLTKVSVSLLPVVS
jgi:hypothetical protein